MMVVLILGLLQPITWSSGPGTREVESFYYYYPVYTIPKVLLGKKDLEGYYTAGGCRYMILS
jgi:hypothetical protein